MRKLTAVICLVTFFMLQYGRIVSYWHCRLVTAVSTEAPCDCEKNYADNPSHNNSHDTAIHFAKEKSEESYCAVKSAASLTPVETEITTHYPAHTFRMPTSPVSAIFHPPC